MTATSLKKITANLFALDLFYTDHVTIWKLGRTVCVYSMVQRKERRRKTRDIYRRHQPLQQSPCIRSVICLRHMYTSNRPRPKDRIRRSQ